MDNQISTKEITLRDLVDIFLKRLWIMALAAAICMAGVFAGTRLFLPSRYESTATLYILRQTEDATSGDASTDFSLALKVVNDCTYMLKSHTVLDGVISEQGLDMTYEELYDCVTTHNPEDTRILEVTVEAESAQQAKQIVDSICTIGAEHINRAMGFDQVNLFELGVPESEPCNRVGLVALFLLGVAATIVTYGVFLVIYLLDDSIRSEEDVMRYLGLSVLGDIPDANSEDTGCYGYGAYGQAGKSVAGRKK